MPIEAVDYLLILLKLVVTAALAALIGYERETVKTNVKGTAGLRTHMLVALGSTLLTLISIYGFSQYSNADPGRIVSYIVMGIGFLGAGTIMALKGEVFGLTTAASIWLVAAIGIAVGLGLYIMAIMTTILALIVLELWRFEKHRKNKL
jgi:putative Mg2+ transporter-C (MgtC) family protein